MGLCSYFHAWSHFAILKISFSISFFDLCFSLNKINIRKKKKAKSDSNAKVKSITPNISLFLDEDGQTFHLFPCGGSFSVLSSFTAGQQRQAGGFQSQHFAHETLHCHKICHCRSNKSWCSFCSHWGPLLCLRFHVISLFLKSFMLSSIQNNPVEQKIYSH